MLHDRAHSPRSEAASHAPVGYTASLFPYTLTTSFLDPVTMRFGIEGSSSPVYRPSGIIFPDVPPNYHTLPSDDFATPSGSPSYPPASGINTMPRYDEYLGDTIQGVLLHASSSHTPVASCDGMASATRAPSYALDRPNVDGLQLSSSRSAHGSRSIDEWIVIPQKPYKDQFASVHLQVTASQAFLDDFPPDPIWQSPAFEDPEGKREGKKFMIRFLVRWTQSFPTRGLE